MREIFSRLLTNAALQDENILLLTGDHGYALFDEIRKEAPDQFINCGIAEQNMIGVAAGLSKAGFLPIVYGLAAFVPMRVLEQIKIDLCYEGLKAILIGDGAGVVYGHLGASHQCTEDLPALRALPNLDIYSPCDVFELEYCFHLMLESSASSYFRFGKADLGSVHTEIPKAPAGDLLPLLKTNSNAAIIATGSMVTTALAVAKDIGALSVWSAPILSPFNKEQLINIAKHHQTIFVMEEHAITGGLGSLVAETLAETRQEKATRVIRIGIQNKFSEHCGDYSYLMNWHGLGQNSIKAKILSTLENNPI